MSRGALRAQVSLTFNDETMYDAFILPAKEDKELSPLIVKLLTSYFYNDKIRALVDGSSELEIKEESENDSRINEMFQNAQQTMAYISVLGDLAQDDLQNGVTAISDIVNATAEATGGTKSTESQFGYTTPKIMQKFLKSDSVDEESPNSINLGDKFNGDEESKNMLFTILTNMESMKANIDKLMRFSGLDKENGDTDIKFVRESSVTEVPKTEVNNNPIFTEVAVDSNTTVKEPVTKVEPSPVVLEEKPYLDDNKSVRVSTNIVQEKTEPAIDGSQLLADFIALGEF